MVLETDKVSVDVRAPFSGVLEAQLAQIDDNVLVGAPLFSVVKQAAGSAPAAATPPAAAASSPAKESAAAPAEEDLETINVPSMGDSISEGTIVIILKSKLRLLKCAGVYDASANFCFLSLNRRWRLCARR